MHRLPTVVSLLAALLIAVCIAGRYPPIAGGLPGLVTDGFALVGFALGAAAAAEARMARGTVGPLWMRVKAAPRLACAVGVSYITTVIAQTLGISLGPVDPTFSATAPAGVGAMWFFVFTLGFTGIGMMSAPSLVLPVLHPPARLLRRVPLPLAVVVLGGVLAGVGVAFRAALVMPAVIEFVTAGQKFCDANQGLVTAAMLVVTLAPVVLPSRARADDDDA
jgi:hypothetical protein